jgi:hypothetical protein
LTSRCDRNSPSVQESLPLHVPSPSLSSSIQTAVRTFAPVLAGLRPSYSLAAIGCALRIASAFRTIGPLAFVDVAPLAQEAFGVITAIVVVGALMRELKVGLVALVLCFANIILAAPRAALIIITTALSVFLSALKICLVISFATAITILTSVTACPCSRIRRKTDIKKGAVTYAWT